VRRLAPRALEGALAEVIGGLAPPTTLARIQAIWAPAVGAQVAAEAAPVSEREGTVVVACRDSMWAQELDLMSRDLLDRVNDALEAAGSARAVRALRFRVGAVNIQE
jgi:predicted nucleic acid-binding Zn ribbon protein